MSEIETLIGRLEVAIGYCEEQKQNCDEDRNFAGHAFYDGRQQATKEIIKSLKKIVEAKE